MRTKKSGKVALLVIAFLSLLALLPAESYELSIAPYSLNGVYLTGVSDGAYIFASSDITLMASSAFSKSSSAFSWLAGLGYGYNNPVRTSPVTFLKGFQTVSLIGGVRAEFSDLLYGDLLTILHYANHLNTNTYFSFISLRLIPQLDLARLMPLPDGYRVAVGLPVTLSVRRDIPAIFTLGASLRLSVTHDTLAALFTGGRR